MFDWFKCSFPRKFSVLLVVGGFLITFTYASVDYLKEKKLYTEILVNQAKQLTETMALLVNENVRYEKYYELWDQLREVHKNNQASNKTGILFFIREIYVTNLDSQILSHTDVKNHPLKSNYTHSLLFNNTFTDSNTPSIQSKRYENKQTLIHRAPLIFGGDIVGYLYLVFDISPVSVLVDNLLTAYIGYLILSSLLIILASFFLVRWVTSPLLNIISILNKIGSGQVKLNELTKRNDEYRTLGLAIEQTDQRINQNHQNLMEQHKIIEKNAAHLAAILDTTVDSIINYNKDGIIKNANKTAYQTFGYNEAELIGKNIEILLTDHGQQQPTLKLDLLSQSEETKRFGQTTELEGLRKNGQAFPIELSIGYWIAGDEKQYTAVVRDITKRKQIEHELIQHQEQLEELVAKRTKALELANNELETFSYSVSHDLRAPLRSIDGFSLALLEDYSDKIDETGQNYLERVRNNTKRMGELIDDILKLSSISRSKITKERINLSQLTKQITNSYKENHPDKPIKWDIEENIFANGDKQLILILLENLLGNAWKYSSKRDLPEIQFGKLENKNIYFVKDNGAGFDMKYSKNLFGVYQRLHGSDEFEGTGIGLATVKRIIQHHGGKIWAEAKIDNGATFFFTLDDPE